MDETQGVQVLRPGSNHSLEEHQRFIEEEVLVYNDDHVNLILCYIHNVFEVLLSNPYKVCFECKHVYQTPGDLEKAYTEVVTEMNKDSLRGGTSLLPVRQPADKIYFCQHCLHDF